MDSLYPIVSVIAVCALLLYRVMCPPCCPVLPMLHVKVQAQWGGSDASDRASVVSVSVANGDRRSFQRAAPRSVVI